MVKEKDDYILFVVGVDCAAQNIYSIHFLNPQYAGHIPLLSTQLHSKRQVQQIHQPAIRLLPELYRSKT